MISQAQDHGGSARTIAVPVVWDGERLTQCGMWPEPVVLEKRQADGGIPGGHIFGEGMGLARQAGEAVTQNAIEAFDVNSVGLRGRWPDRFPHLDVA